MPWEERLRVELAFVYGGEVGGRLADALTALVRQSHSMARGAGSRPADPDGAILITYGDQVAGDGERPLAALRGFLCDHVRGFISGVHVLPFYPWSSDDGFAVKDFFAVDEALGTWEDARALGGEFDLMVDAVFNHASAEGEWFHKFRAAETGFEEFFVTVEDDAGLSAVVRPRALPLLTPFETARGTRLVWTTFSADQVDLNLRDPRVMKALCEALLFYLEQGARLVRLDAIGFVWKEPGTTCIHLPQAHALVRAWRALADGAAPGARIVTETNVPHADNISYFGDGGNEAHMVYNFALPPLVLHTLGTGDASALTRWAADLHTPSRDTAFFNFLASHDGIGLNPVRGILQDSEIAALIEMAKAAGGFVSMKSLPGGGETPYELNVNFFDVLATGVGEDTALRRFTVAHAIAFALAGVPGVYFHSLFGSRGDVEGARMSGIPRRINREKLLRTALEADLADSTSRRRRILDHLAGLLRMRRANPAFALSSPQAVRDFGPGIFALERGAGSGRIVCLHEISGRAATVEVAGCWRGLDDGKTFVRAVPLAPYGIRWMGALT